MEQTAFFVVGIALVVVALVVSISGLRSPGFPGSRPALAGGAALLVVLVAGATTTAVINAREEQREHNEEAAAEEEQTETQAEETGESPKQLEEQGAKEAQTGGGGGGGPALELSAPEDGTLAFDTDELEAGAGEVTIDFTNPAAIEHDVAIGTDGDEIDKSDLVSDGQTAEASAKLDPGEYVFYCTVPGHREGGMEGTLTVK